MGRNALSHNSSKAVLLVVLLAFFCAPLSYCQELWTDANFKYPLSPKWTLSLGTQYRMTEQLKATKRVAANIGVTYMPLNFMTIDADYEFQQRRSSRKETPTAIIPSFWNTYNRVNVSVSLSWRIQSIILSLRERYGVTHRSAKTVLIEDNIGRNQGLHKIASNTSQVLRTRAQIRWATPNFPVDPFFNAEIFEDMGSKCYIDRVRYTVGVNIKLGAHNMIKPYYRYIDNLDGTSDYSVIGLSYEYSF